MQLDDLSFDVLHPEPLLVVISGPSGVGKDSVVKALKERNYPMHFVVTATSRPPRPGEVNGVDYFFMSKQEFEQMIASDELIEHSLVYNDYKGIPKRQIREALVSGKDTILRVDVQGAIKVRKLCPEAVMIFILPHDADEWYRRLANRNTETPENLQRRLSAARDEMNQLDVFDYLVINAENCLDQAVESIIQILSAEHHRHPHRKISI